MESPEQAPEESAPAAEERPVPRGRRIGPLEFVLGFLLCCAGILGFVAIPMTAMFSEGLPEATRNSPGLFYLETAAASFGSFLAGVGLLRGRSWGRLVAIVLAMLFGLAIGTLASIVVGFGIATVLAARWRTE